LVAGVKAAAGEQAVGDEEARGTVVVDDWDLGEVKVEMYKEILDRYPIKVSGSDQCDACDGRGVVVCDNCEGTGIQPRFLERYSPDDFMD
jgi:predicted methyltransferase